MNYKKARPNLSDAWLNTDRSARFTVKASDGDRLRGAYRRQFLRALRLHAPEVYEDLRDSVLPAYSAIFDRENGVDYTSDPYRHHELDDPRQILTASDTNYPERLALKEALVRWASKWNLAERWLLEHAVDCLSATKQMLSPPFSNLLIPGFRPWTAGIGFVPELQFVFLADAVPSHDRPNRWQAEAGESWKEFETRIDAAFAAYKAEHMRAVMDWLVNQGQEFERAPQPKRDRLGIDKAKGASTGDEHFRWLVLHRVKGLSYAAIAGLLAEEGLTPSEQAIAYGAKNAATRAGLPTK